MLLGKLFIWINLENIKKIKIIAKLLQVSIFAWKNMMIIVYAYGS